MPILLPQHGCCCDIFVVVEALQHCCCCCNGCCGIVVAAVVVVIASLLFWWLFFPHHFIIVAAAVIVATTYFWCCCFSCAVLMPQHGCYCRGLAIETTAHFHSCTQTECIAIWNNMHEQLYKHHNQNNTGNIFHDLMAYGLYLGRDCLTTLYMDHLPHEIQDIHDAQAAALGWKQIYYGRLSTQWPSILNYYHPMVNSINYYIKSLVVIWKQHYKHGKYVTNICIQQTKSKLIAANYRLLSSRFSMKHEQTLFYKKWWNTQIQKPSWHN